MKRKSATARGSSKKISNERQRIAEDDGAPMGRDEEPPVQHTGVWTLNSGTRRERSCKRPTLCHSCSIIEVYARLRKARAFCTETHSTCATDTGGGRIHGHSTLSSSRQMSLPSLTPPRHPHSDGNFPGSAHTTPLCTETFAAQEHSQKARARIFPIT